MFRTNIDKELLDNFKEFKEWAYKTFDNPKFVFDFIPVTKYSNIVSDDLVLDCCGDDYDKLVEERDLNERSSTGYLMPFQPYKYCLMFNPNVYSILPDGALVKCEDDQQCDDNVIVGYLKQDGTIEFNENLDVRTKNMETEECKECIAFPMCGGRLCPHKKAMSVLHNIPRYDCYNMKNDFITKLQPYIEKKMWESAEKETD